MGDGRKELSYEIILLIRELRNLADAYDLNENNKNRTNLFNSTVISTTTLRYSY